MNTTYKPFRLLTNKEINYFTHMIRRKIDEFNQDYSIKNLHISCNLTTIPVDDLLLVKNNETFLALVEKNHLSLLKQSVFGDNSSCFNPICETIFIQLMADFFNLNAIDLVPNNTCRKEWFYKGAPTIHLSLCNETEQLSLYLHPNWVLAQLPPSLAPSKRLTKINDALANEKVLLSIKLEPLRLSLANLSGLRRGMVIKTDQLLSNPLFLNYKKIKLCQVELGKLHENRSIRLGAAHDN